MTTPTPRSSRGNPKLGDILRTVLVMGLIVLGIWAFGLLFTRTPHDPVRHVDLTSDVRAARQGADDPLLAPRSIPQRWRPNGDRFDPTGAQPWHLGMLTDDGEYIGLEQQRRSAAAMIKAFARGSRADGSVRLGDATWDRRSGPGRQVAYLRRVGDSVVIVVSDANPADVRAYVSLLSES
jgi:hypothetical protein